MNSNISLSKSIFLIPMVLLSAISFETTLYKYYSITSIFSFLAILFIILHQYGVLKFNQSYWFFIISFCIFSFLISLYYFNVISMVRSIFTFFSFYLCYLLVVNKINLLKIFFYVSLIPLIFSYIIQIKSVFLIWDMIAGRNASFMFDPNYCGVFFVCSSLIALIIFKNFYLRWFYFTIFSLGVLFTFSKGAIAALLGGIIIYLFCKYKSKSIIYIAISTLFFLFFYLYSGFDFSLLRIDQGLNGRDGFYHAVINHVFYSGNFMGGGDNVLKNLLENNYFDNASTHNFYMDLLVTNGLFPLTILIIFIIYIGVIGLKDRSIYLCLFVALFIASNSISISIGGVGILSLIFTFSALMILQRKDTLL